MTKLICRLVHLYSVNLGVFLYNHCAVLQLGNVVRFFPSLDTDNLRVRYNPGCS